jgi:ElaA protein
LRCYALPFTGLTPTTLYAVARLRQDVFVVEQECPYPDLDGRDLEPGTRHVLLESPESSDGPAEVVGYARVLDDGERWRIGRVLLARSARGQGLADVVMRTAMSVATGRDVVLDAQAPLAGWYATFGFAVTGPEYLEDGIPHVPMALTRSDQPR